jgi:hypothetical protein
MEILIYIVFLVLIILILKNKKKLIVSYLRAVGIFIRLIRENPTKNFDEINNLAQKYFEERNKGAKQFRKKMENAEIFLKQMVFLEKIDFINNYSTFLTNFNNDLKNEVISSSKKRMNLTDALKDYIFIFTDELKEVYIQNSKYSKSDLDNVNK